MAPTPGSRRASLAADAVGRDAHAVIAQLVASHPPRPNPSLVDRAVRAQLPSDLAPVYRQSLRARVGTAVSLYFGRFDRRPDWQPLGAEVHVDDVRLDILWLGPHGRIEADEIKAGPAAIGMNARSTLVQASSQLRAGRRIFGTRFAGVRVVILAHPDQSFTVTNPNAGGPADVRPRR